MSDLGSIIQNSVQRFTLFLSRAQKGDQLMVSGNQIRLNRIFKKGKNALYSNGSWYFKWSY